MPKKLSHCKILAVLQFSFYYDGIRILLYKSIPIQPVTAIILNHIANFVNLKAKLLSSLVPMSCTECNFFLFQIELKNISIAFIWRKRKSIYERDVTEGKVNRNIIKLSLERLDLWLMGNMLPGKLCRLLMSQNACPHYRLANSKHGAAIPHLLGALAHGPPDVREHWPHLVN